MMVMVMVMVDVCEGILLDPDRDINSNSCSK